MKKFNLGVMHVSTMLGLAAIAFASFAVRSGETYEDLAIHEYILLTPITLYSIYLIFIWCKAGIKQIKDEVLDI